MYPHVSGNVPEVWSKRTLPLMRIIHYYVYTAGNIIGKNCQINYKNSQIKVRRVFGDPSIVSRDITDNPEPDGILPPSSVIDDDECEENTGLPIRGKAAVGIGIAVAVIAGGALFCKAIGGVK